MSMKKAMVFAITFSLLAILGVSLIVFNLRNADDFNKCIRIEQSSEEQTAFQPQENVLEINVAGLVPGGEPVEYTVSFDVLFDDKYTMTLSFYDEGSTLLKDYVDVTVGVLGNAEPEYFGKMSDLFNTKHVVFSEEINTRQTLYIRFSMDVSVDNTDIMGNSLDFETVLKVEKS